MFGSKRKKQLEQMADIIAVNTAEHLIDFLSVYAETDGQLAAYLTYAPVVLDHLGWDMAKRKGGIDLERELRKPLNTKLTNAIAGYLLKEFNVSLRTIQITMENCVKDFEVWQNVIGYKKMYQDHNEGAAIVQLMIGLIRVVTQTEPDINSPVLKYWVDYIDTYATMLSGQEKHKPII